MSGMPGSNSLPAVEPGWAPLSPHAYPWCLMTVRIYTRDMVTRERLVHRVMSVEEQARYLEKVPMDRPPDPPPFDLASLGVEEQRLSQDKRALLALEARSHGYQSQIAHHQALAETKIVPDNYLEREIAWVPLGRHQSTTGDLSRKLEGTLALLCSPSQIYDFFHSAPSALVLLQGMVFKSTGPMGPKWAVNQERIIPLHSPFLRPQVFLPLNTLPVFPLPGEGQRVELLNQVYQAGGLWTVLDFRGPYDPVRDGL